uniref:Cathepsin L n=1 Tax=Lygus hesperus TaxID=30085 RepID=A0A0A9VTD9_LYGHE
MKLFFAVTCLLAVAAAFPKTEISAEEWLAFKAQHGKIYASQEEEAQRFKIYLENKQMVNDHNQKYERGEVSYRLALNKFADIRSDELRRGGKLRRPAASMNVPLHVNSNQPLPASVDWRTTPGAVGEPRYIMMCESSWAFSALGSVVSQLAIKKGLHFPLLSPQNLVDCTRTYILRDDGCEGGWVDDAFQYIQQNGIQSEDDYWYHGYDENCVFNKSLVVPGVVVTGFFGLKPGSEDDLMDAVANVGPISVTVGAYDNAFMTYGGGIYNPAPATCTTDPRTPNHAVLLVGYGSEKGQNFWIIQNVWGGDWGEQGYMRLARNGTNLCGIASQASYPTVL